MAAQHKPNILNKPNILWICTDQQRFDTIREMNNPYVRTPNLDRLVKQGVAFSKAYCQSPVCSPSRASFLTGRYPRTTRVTSVGNEYFPADEVLVTKMLADQGYACGLVGKFHLSANQMRKEQRPDDGYETFKWIQWSHGGKEEREAWGDFNAYLAWLAAQGVSYDEQYQEEMEGKERCGGIETRYHSSVWAVEEAMGFIDAHREEPWLLSLNIFDPHDPYDPPQEYRDRYRVEDMPLPKWKAGELDRKPWIQQQDYIIGGQEGIGPSCKDLSEYQKKQYVADYYAMIELVDDQLGRLFDHLERTGQRENTVILFHSDHGEMLGDHGLILKGAYFYEGLVHVPLIISWPGHLQQNCKSEALVELVDIAPTLLDMLGLDIPYWMQGKSLLPLLNGQSGLHHHKDSVYCEFYRAMLGVHDHVYATMYFDGTYKLVAYHGRNTGELYDFRTDPDEYDNVWSHPDYQALKMELLQKCFDRSVFTVDPKPRLAARY